jgi:hypothetical protein
MCHHPIIRHPRGYSATMRSRGGNADLWIKPDSTEAVTVTGPTT